MTNRKEPGARRRWRLHIPHVYAMLFTILIIAALATWVVTPGAYDRVEGPGGRMVVDPNSFHVVERSPVGFFGLFRAVHKGMVQSADIIFFIFIVGAAFSVINATGAIEAGIEAAARKLRGSERLAIPILVILFSLGGAIFGMAEETLAFVPVIVPFMLALGFDSMTAAGIVLGGANAGFSAAFMNPFTVGVAQGIAELPLFSGMGLRLAAYASFVLVTAGYIYWYAGRVKANPLVSPTYAEDRAKEKDLGLDQSRTFEPRHKLVFLVVAASIAMLIYGVIKLGWYITEIAGLFLAMGVIGGLAGRLTPDKIAEEFVKGAKELTYGALLVGLARSLLVVLSDGHIMDTLLHSMATAIGGLPSLLTAWGMYAVQCLLDFVVPSGSGQAAVSMPIMAPLADLVGVTRQTAVLALQFGDGISNIYSPTSGYFMAGLALAGVTWPKWLRWVAPLIAMQYVLGLTFMTIAQLIHYGPF
ncbi:MAG: hypothetical protein PWQ41_835 [Bacillota bacterium]|jgi:uncharacterized ion transporter superfamily protein YfcC|nr:hypothetical protein [Bacillota bacterium]MDK2856039.1 hypothetical protein [Bacillota bacterium]MDK2925061.1 hypothetical protein [Bacillota bacterium]